MRPLPHPPGADRRETGRRARGSWRLSDEDPDLADDEGWIAVQEF